MAAELADVVKGLHKKLREELKKADGDYEKTWKDHCSDKESLQRYASAMHSLATDHWSKNSPGGRADWCVKTCQEYFKGGGLETAIEKQKRRIDKEMGTVCCCCLNADVVSNTLCTSLTDGKLNLLDVGSCYNPFDDFKEFLSIALDLHPATESVFKCDFLDLHIQDETTNHHSGKKSISCSCRKNEQNRSSEHESTECTISQEQIDITKFLEKTEVSELPGRYFHVVVFSLLLSYFPCSIQRWNCCIKAHKLLAVNGILIIITPDSSHQNRNVEVMKSWKVAIESVGFVRWRYVKDTHVHCMVFRKVSPCHHSCSKTCSCNVSVHVKPEMLFMRQDFHEEHQEGDETISVDGPVSKKPRKAESESSQ